MLKIRRDSTVSELDERLKEAKLTNKKFRKQLLQKDSELQVSFSIHQTSKRHYSKYYFEVMNLLYKEYVTQSTITESSCSFRFYSESRIGFNA